MEIIILGIDPGSRSTGFGVIKTDGQNNQFITCGTISTGEKVLSKRLNDIYLGMREVVQTYQPQEVSIEQVFFHTNPSTALKLGQARGAAIVACTQDDIDIAEYSARQIKKSVVGYGAASKEQVQHMIRSMLGLNETPQNDAADGLAAALCHAHMRRGLANLSGGRQLRRRRVR